MKLLKFISEKNVHIVYRFACKMINLINKICHTRDQPLQCVGRGAIIAFVLLQHVKVLCGELLGMGCCVGINTPISMVNPWQREGVTV